MFSRLALLAAILVCAVLWISLGALSLGSFSNPSDQQANSSPLPVLAVLGLAGLLLWRWQPGRAKS